MIQPFMPYLMGDDEEKKQLAIEAIYQLGNAKLATFAAMLRPSVGSARALQTIAGSPNLVPVERQRVEQVLRSLPDSIRAQLLPVPDTAR